MNRDSILVSGLREQVVQRLRDDLLCGRLPAGQRIVERDLVDRFGVSRTPIREAIAQLSYEGLLEVLPHRSVRVAATPPDEIHRLILPIRATLESYALETIFPLLGEDDFRAWDQWLDEFEQACRSGDRDATVNLDIAFHRSIIHRAASPDLEAIWSAIVVRVRAYFWEAHREYEDLMDLYHEHRHIIDVFRSGDQQAAIDVLVTSIS